MRDSITILVEADGDRRDIGGKARGLLQLKRAGLPIPEAWVIPTDVFLDHANEVPELASSDAEMRQRLERQLLSDDVPRELVLSLHGLPGVPYAVRSSASVEDGAQASYSGLFHTRLGAVGVEAIADAIRAVWASAVSAEVVAYHEQVSGDTYRPSVAVLLMPMLDSEVAGVAFSALSQDGNPFRIAIQVCRGLGTRVVDGREHGAGYVLDLDTLDILESEPGQQELGDFLQPDGSVAARPVHDQAALSDAQLNELGKAVRLADEALGCRVDLEFAFTSAGLQVLQARPLLALPPYFPDDPAGEGYVCFQATYADPLPPLVQELITGPLTHQRVPQPPWSPEVSSVVVRHGRGFSRWDGDILERDMEFLEALETAEHPEEYFRSQHAWTEYAYETVIPSTRDDSTRLLSLERRELSALSDGELASVLQEAFDVEHRAGVFYISSSSPTSYYAEMTEKLLQQWLPFDQSPPRVYSTRAEQLAMELIEGVPTLTHARDAQLQQLAWGNGALEDFIRRWGYSYIIRDEQLCWHRWQSWREDPGPLHQAIELMRHASDRTPLSERLEESRRRAQLTLSSTLDKLTELDPQRYARRAELLRVWVRFGQAHFRMKDDRDLVWSHAQAALRWILMEAARRFQAGGAIGNEGDVFYLTSQEILGSLRDGVPAAVATRIQERRGEVQRLSRYVPRLNPQSDSPAPLDGAVMIGIPTGAGAAEGKAHIVREKTALRDLAGLEDGDVLVFLGEGKVGLTMFIQQIVGLAYSCGNGFCHEVNTLRELGKPAIVSLGENAYMIREGEQLRLDASRGTLTLLDR